MTIRYLRTLGVGACLLAGAAFVLVVGQRYHPFARWIQDLRYRGELGAFAGFGLVADLAPRQQPGGEVLWVGTTTWSLDHLQQAMLEHLARQGYREPSAPEWSQGTIYLDRGDGRCLVAAVKGEIVSCAAVLDLGARRRLLIGSAPLAKGGALEPDLAPLRRILPPELQPERLLEPGE